jgi:hypothetical protein
LIDPQKDGAGPTSRRRLAIRRAALAVLLGSGVLTLAACHSGSAVGSPTSEPAYGSLPSFLPTSSIQPDGVLTGTAAHPALTTEGDVVEVRTTGYTVRATVSGPVVPGEGLPNPAAATTCTWTLTLSDATASVPIDLADFTTIDHLGMVYRVAPVAGQPAPPTVLGPGQTVTFELRAVMPTGEGLMRWAPGGKSIVASWDFEVEND